MWCLHTSPEDLKAAHQTAWPGHHQELENPQRYSTSMKLFLEQLVQKQLLDILPHCTLIDLARLDPEALSPYLCPSVDNLWFSTRLISTGMTVGTQLLACASSRGGRNLLTVLHPEGHLSGKKKDLEKQRTASVGGTNNSDLLFQTPQLTEPLFVSTQFTWNILHYSSGQEAACWQIKYQMRDRWHHFWRSTKPSFLYTMLMALKSPLLIFTIFPAD